MLTGSSQNSQLQQLFEQQPRKGEQEQEKTLSELADEARHAKQVAITQEEVHRRLEEEFGFQTDVSLKLDRGRTTAVLHSELGRVTVRTEVAFPAGTESPEELIQSAAEQASQPSRFLCGGQWYTLKRPLLGSDLKELSGALAIGLPTDAERMHRHLHFHFQRLYRMPVDAWDNADTVKWELLAAYIDVDAYEAENPAPENRIGRLLKITPENISVQWNTAGIVEYDSRDVPSFLVTAAEGWLVHAEVQVLPRGTQRWISGWVESPIASDSEIVEADTATRKSSLEDVAEADWPRI
jgi:hypothetical protein